MEPEPGFWISEVEFCQVSGTCEPVVERFCVNMQLLSYYSVLKA